MSNWKIETICVDGKKVVFEMNDAGVFKVLEQERDVTISETSQTHAMVTMMEQSKYVKMECTRIN